MSRDDLLQILVALAVGALVAIIAVAGYVAARTESPIQPGEYPIPGGHP